MLLQILLTANYGMEVLSKAKKIPVFLQKLQTPIVRSIV